MESGRATTQTTSYPPGCETGIRMEEMVLEARKFRGEE